MKTTTTLSWIQKSVYSAFAFFGTLVALSLVYAATTYYSDLPNASSGSGLTATSWNNLVNYANKAVKQETEVLTITGGKVGIGTASPGARLDINLTSGNQLDPILILRSTLNPASYITYYSNLAAWQTNPSVLNGDQALIFTNDSSATTYTNGLVISWWSDKWGLKIMENGNVGIGVSNPSVTLHVNGTIKATGGTPIYSCPNNSASSCTASCNGSLSLSSTCTYSTTNLPCTWTTATCTLVGRMVEP